MVTVAPASRAAMDARHAARAPKAKEEPAPQNVRAVLELGDAQYIMFRGRPFGVPPVPWRAGQRLLLLWTEARSYPSPLTADTAPKYFAAISQLPPLLWSLTRPVGIPRRVLRALGLLRNPFARATEGELVALAGFFLMRRTMSSVGLLPASPEQRTS